MLFVVFGAGTLAVCGVVFALFLGVSSSRVEARREQELEEREHEHGSVGHAS